MSTANPTANLVDQANPTGPPTPLWGPTGPFGGSQQKPSLLFAILIELMVSNHYRHQLAAGIPVAVTDDPTSMRQMILSDPGLVQFN